MRLASAFFLCAFLYLASAQYGNYPGNRPPYGGTPQRQPTFKQPTSGPYDVKPFQGYGTGEAPPPKQPPYADVSPTPPSSYGQGNGNPLSRPYEIPQGRPKPVGTPEYQPAPAPVKPAYEPEEYEEAPEEPEEKPLEETPEYEWQPEPAKPAKPAEPEYVPEKPLEPVVPDKVPSSYPVEKPDEPSYVSEQPNHGYEPSNIPSSGYPTPQIPSGYIPDTPVPQYEQPKPKPVTSAPYEPVEKPQPASVPAAYIPLTTPRPYVQPAAPINPYVSENPLGAYVPEKKPLAPVGGYPSGGPQPSYGLTKPLPPSYAPVKPVESGYEQPKPLAPKPTEPEDYGFGDDDNEKGPDGCICVPYYQCENGKIVTDGVGIIDPRMKKPAQKELPLVSTAKMSISQLNMFKYKIGWTIHRPVLWYVPRLLLRPRSSHATALRSQMWNSKA